MAPQLHKLQAPAQLYPKPAVPPWLRGNSMLLQPLQQLQPDPQQLVTHLCSPQHRMLVQAKASKTDKASRRSRTAVLDEPQQPAHQIQDRELHEEASASYLAYAMSVIVGRALPDVRDGLKPVHRRILYAMHDLGLSADKPFKKCARVVGEVLGKYHPHGDTAVYDALVRLAQDFSMRHQLVSGHGNFGSLDDDPPAAMRYTECRLQGVSSDMLLSDLDQQLVDFIPTFDGSQDEPTVLPAKLPNLLINGSQGIAVGIATKIPPHNMLEVVEGLSALIKNPDISVAQLMQHIPAPDFPTGNTVVVGSGTTDMYLTGHGHVLIRASVAIEDDSQEGRKRRGSSNPRLVISDVPFQTSKSELVAAIATLAENKTVDGIADVRDESDRTGTRVVVEVKPGASPEAVLSALYRTTRLQIRFAANMVALVGGTPKQLNLKECLQHFLQFRCEVVRRRSSHQMAVAERKLLQLKGYLKALQHMDQVVQLIRQSDDTASARSGLMTSIGLTKEQADAVLGLPLRRLSRLEVEDVQQESKELKERVAKLRALLSDESKVIQVVEAEAREVAAKHGNPRRSRVLQEQEVDDLADDSAAAADAAALVSAPAPVLIMCSGKGFLQRLDLTEPLAKLKAKVLSGVRSGDALKYAVAADEADQLLVITPKGLALRIKASAVPEAGKGSYGASTAQVLGAKTSVSIAGLVHLPAAAHQPSSSSPSPAAPSPDGLEPTDEPSDQDCTGQEEEEGQPLQQEEEEAEAGGPHMVLVTRLGQVKKVAMSGLTRISKAGATLYKVKQGDEVQWVGVSHQASDLVLIASNVGRVTLFKLSEVRASKKGSGGIQGMRLREGHYVIGAAVLPAAAAAVPAVLPAAAAVPAVLPAAAAVPAVLPAAAAVPAVLPAAAAAVPAVPADTSTGGSAVVQQQADEGSNNAPPAATDEVDSVGASRAATGRQASASPGVVAALAPDSGQTGGDHSSGPWVLLQLMHGPFVHVSPACLNLGGRAQAGTEVFRSPARTRRVGGGRAREPAALMEPPPGLAGVHLITSPAHDVWLSTPSSLECVPSWEVLQGRVLGRVTGTPDKIGSQHADVRAAIVPWPGVALPEQG